MIKTVYFDFFNTLAYFDPPREITYSAIARELGVDATPEGVEAALPKADDYWRMENYKSPIQQRKEDDKIAAYKEYGIRILAGTNATRDQALQMLARTFVKGFAFKSFDDSVEALKLVKTKNLSAGVISNVRQEIDTYCRELGFEPYLDFKVTSFEVGYDKPRPEIFQMALSKAGVKASEAMYIGDQYNQDVVGARGVGMKAILIDRKRRPQSYDCPVINSLSQLSEYI